MATTVELVLGDSYAERHEQFKQALGEQYSDELRMLVENHIHEVTQNIERANEGAVGGAGGHTHQTDVGTDVGVSESVE